MEAATLPAEAGFFLDQPDEALVEAAKEAQAEAENAEAEAGSPHRWRMADAFLGLRNRGWTQQRIAKTCGVSQTTVSRYVRLAGDYSLGNRPTFWEAWRDLEGRGLDIHYSSETPEWETPQDLFDLLDAEFGFTLDVCATADNAKCDDYFDAGADGLAQEWTGVCWMNPPYGDEIAAWVEKAHAAGDAGATVVCLVPARTDTAWWWEHARFGEVRFLRGRLRFGNATSGAPFPSAVVVFGYRPRVVWWEAWPMD